MRNRSAISLALCLCLLLAAGCTAAPSGQKGSASPADTPAAEQGPAPQQQPAPTALPAPDAAQGFPADAGRSFPFAAIREDTLYWCTAYGVLSMQAGGDASRLSEVRGRYPLVLNGALYLIEDDLDITDDAPWPAEPDVVTQSRILRIPLDGGEATEIYKEAYISSLATADERLYFCTTRNEALSEAGGLFSIDRNGGDVQLLAEDCSLLLFAGSGFAYYMGMAGDAAALCRVPLDGGEIEPFSVSAGVPRTPIAAGGALYYIHFDLANADDPDRFAIMRFQDGESTSTGVNATELLGIWAGKLYYLAMPAHDAPASDLAAFDLATMDTQVIYSGVQEIAALGEQYAAYASGAPLLFSASLELAPLTGGKANSLNAEDIVENQD